LVALFTSANDEEKAMFKNKRLIGLLVLALIMVLALAACDGDDDDDGEEQEVPTPVVTVEPTEEATEEPT